MAQIKWSITRWPCTQQQELATYGFCKEEMNSNVYLIKIVVQFLVITEHFQVFNTKKNIKLSNANRCACTQKFSICDFSPIIRTWFYITKDFHYYTWHFKCAKLETFQFLVHPLVPPRKHICFYDKKLNESEQAGKVIVSINTISNRIIIQYTGSDYLHNQACKLYFQEYYHLLIILDHPEETIHLLHFNATNSVPSSLKLCTV